MAKAAASATVTVLMLSTCAIAFDAASETRYQTDSLCPLNMPPRFDHGYLAVYEWSGVGIYAASGALQYRIPKLPNALTMNVAVDKDGTAVTSGDFSDGKGALWLWNSAGSNIRVIRTPPITFRHMWPSPRTVPYGRLERETKATGTHPKITRSCATSRAKEHCSVPICPGPHFLAKENPPSQSWHCQPCALLTVGSVCISPAVAGNTMSGIKRASWAVGCLVHDCGTPVPTIFLPVVEQQLFGLSAVDR